MEERGRSDVITMTLALFFKRRFRLSRCASAIQIVWPLRHCIHRELVNRRFQFQKRSQLFIRTHVFAQPKVQPRFFALARR